uniref:E3 ubiquitin-protein ligase n=1 Tax=Eptatretus burgeri TaxID=7764 RepID=A0A8C4QJ45_EPTBU
MSCEPEETGGLGGSGSPPGIPDCAVCLQECVHPALLPCGHVFCFLCAKGVALQSRRCALCRRDIPPDFLERPTLLPQSSEMANAWFYEGRNGWWQYDERTTGELEEAFSKGWTSLEMLIAGFLYVADLEAMVQYRRNEPTRRRRIKRDLACAPKKGVAGLRLEQATSSSRETSGDGTAAVEVSGIARMQNPVATSVSSIPINQPATEAVSDSTAVNSRFSGIRLGVGIPGIPAPSIATIIHGPFQEIVRVVRFVWIERHSECDHRDFCQGGKRLHPVCLKDEGCHQQMEGRDKEYFPESQRDHC